MAGPNTTISEADGTLDFSAGVNSIKVRTVQSQQNTTGLARNELSWLINGSVRDGGISPRGGWQPKGVIHDGSSVYQGGVMYEPDNANPYLILSIGGNIYRVVSEIEGDMTVTNLSSAFGLTMPADQVYSHFCQAEQFVVIQAGDFVTKPLFWDGAILRRSIGITNTAVVPGTPGVNEIPAAGPMDYFQGRLWYAQGRTYSAGDIVRGPSGTIAYSFRDSILNVTENPMVVGGDGFTVPNNAGNIRCLAHNANLNTTLGEQQLFAFTRKAAYALEVPVTRTDWINANSNNQPRQSVVQFVNGAVNDRCVVPVNGDLFYQSLEPGIRSLVSAIRYFDQWGNIQISANENRILQFNDRALLRFASGIVFDNRLLQTALPRQVPQGVVHDALIPLDFVPISNFNEGRAPVWEGAYAGLQILQLFTGDFGGLERAFAVVVSRLDGSIQLWEIFDNAIRTENGDNRIEMIIEFPAFTWGNEFSLKRLLSAELWIDRLWGSVDFTLEWRPDGENCWYLWRKWNVCSSRNSAEDMLNPITYPLETHGEGYKSTMSLPLPPEICQAMTGRPANIGYQFQARLTIHGYCRVRGFLLHAASVDRKLYQGIIC